MVCCTHDNGQLSTNRPKCRKNEALTQSTLFRSRVGSQCCQSKGNECER